MGTCPPNAVRRREIIRSTNEDDEMAQSTQSSEIVIFVTHVEAEEGYLKIWGQVDKNAATCIEHYILPLINQFNEGYGCPSRANNLAVGMVCCAKFQSEGYYRAKIHNIHADGTVLVHFIDYGNMEVLHLNEIRLLRGMPGAEPLQNFPPIAAEFTLADVLPINGIWENRVIETIKKNLCYTEYRAIAHPMMNNRCLIKLSYNNENFSDVLVREHMALPIISQDMSRYCILYFCLIFLFKDLY